MLRLEHAEVADVEDDEGEKERGGDGQRIELVDDIVVGLVLMRLLELGVRIIVCELCISLSF